MQLIKVTHRNVKSPTRRLRGPAPALLSGRGWSRARAQARVQRLLQSPPLQPGGPGSRELSPCPLFSLVLLPLREAGFSQQMCHCRPLLARSNLFLPSRNPSFSGSNKRNKARAGNLPEGRGAAKSGHAARTSLSLGENQLLGVRGSAGPSAPSQDSEGLSLGLLLSTPTGDCAGPTVPPLWH